MSTHDAQRTPSSSAREGIKEARGERSKKEERVERIEWLAILAERLERLGMPMQGERLARTAALGLLYSHAPHELHDLLLMGIAVEADYRPDADAPIWV
jgi:hypothetical protein